MRLRNYLLLPLVPALVLAACGESSTVEPDPPRPSEVVVAGPDSLMVGDTATLHATVLDQHGVTMTTTPVEWTSSDSLVLRVTTAGAVEALADGTARVMAAAGDASATLEIRAYPVPAVILAEDTIVMTARGDSVAVSASVFGELVSVQLSPLSETRWNDDLRVAHVAGNAVVAAGAGAALYLVEADSHPSSTPDTLFVRVQPEVPYLTRIEASAPVGPGSPIVLHGYGLNGLPAGAITVEGQAAEVSTLDSAAVSVTFDAIPQEVCVGARATLEVAGADILPEDVTFQRQRTGSISLQVGEARRITPEEADCIKVEGPDSARFALAHYDARYAYSRGEDLPYRKSEGFSITLADASGETAALSSATGDILLRSDPPLARSYARPHESLALAADSVRPGDEWMHQTTPYQLGDTLTVGPYTLCRDPESQEVEVILVVDDYLTVSAPVDSLASMPAGSLDSFLNQVRQFDAQHGQWIQTLFGSRPGLANGQYMVLVCPVRDGWAGGGGSGRMMMYVDYESPAPDSSRYYGLLAHEYAHSAQSAHDAQDNLRVGGTPDSEMWWGEGLASMIELRAMGEYLGQSFRSNLQHNEVWASPPFGFLAQAGGGDIESGYEGAAGFGFDLTWRLADATGLSWQAAHDTVTLAMAHNRYGCSPSGCDSFDGLYDVMQRHMGPEWNPVDAVLTYTASHALDDLIQSEVYQHPSVYRVAELYNDGEPAGGVLGPKTEITAYSGDTVAVPATGNFGITSIHAGSTGWTRLIGGGGAFRATSDAEQIEWLLIRIQ